MEDGAKKWIEQEIDICAVDIRGWINSICFHEMVMGA